MKRLPFLLLFWIFLGIHSENSLAQQYNFKRISIEEGLPQAGVYDIMEDSHGFLWIALEGGGVCLYDGVDIKNYTIADGLASNAIRCIAEDDEGNMWFGTTGNGVSKFDGKHFTTYNGKQGLSSDHVRAIFQDDYGDMWFGTFSGGVCKMVKNAKDSTQQFLCFTEEDGLANNRIWSGLKDSKGNIWWGTGEGISMWNGKAFKNFTIDDGLPDNTIRAIFEDGLGNMLFATDNGAAEFDGSEFRVYNTQTGLISNSVRAIQQDKIGNLYFGTEDGVTRYDGSSYEHFTESEGLSNKRIRDIHLDDAGNLWFGTYFGGVNRYSGDDFVHFSEKEGLRNNQVLSMYADAEETIWLGTYKGLSKVKFDFNKLEALDNINLPAINDAPINKICAYGTDELLLAVNGGLYLYDKSSKLTLLLKESFVFSVYSDSTGIWVGLRNNLLHADELNGAQTVFEDWSERAGTKDYLVSTFYKDNEGRLWLGCSDGPLVVYDKGNFTTVSDNEKLELISSISQDTSGNLWVSTEGHGLFRLGKRPNRSSFDIRHYVPKEGLSSNNIYAAIFDDEHYLWLGYGNGADRLQLDHNGDILQKKHFGINEGFVGIQTNSDAVYRDGWGNIWFGTVKGVTRYNPYARSINRQESQTHITKIRLFYDDIDWGNMEYADGVEGRFSKPKNLMLPYDENHLSFDFIGVNLKAPTNVLYQWKMEGFDDKWRDPTYKHDVTYNNLPPGQYTFMVKSCNDDGLWDKEPTTFSFEITPPFWRTWWFYILVSISGLTLIFIFTKARERKLIKDKEKLQLLVDERTAEVVKQKEELVQEKKKSDQLLLNILPQETADELKSRGKASVKHYDKVSVLFTDFVGFTKITEKISHEELVKELDHYFRSFDEIMEKYGIEKIKTIGDAYMCAGGLPVPNRNNPVKVVLAGLEMQRLVDKLNEDKKKAGVSVWNIRLGIHTGEVIAGVVGKKKFAYDIWGDTVNTASRIESGGETGKVNISGATYELVKDYFNCTYRGKLPAKNKGEIDMYFVESIKAEYSEKAEGVYPNDILLEVITA